MNSAARRSARGKHKKSAAIAPAEMLEEAIRRHRAGEWAAAEVIYRRLIEAQPRNPDALHFLGVLHHQAQRTEDAIALVRHALEIAPGYVDAWNNLGNLYKESDRLQEAEAAYRKALALDAGHAGACNNLGVVLWARRQMAESIAAFRQAIEISPGFAGAHLNLANALRICGRLADAIAEYRKTIALDAGNVGAHYRLGYALYLTGARADAAEVFRDWAAVKPGNPIATHMLAACSGEGVPERASDEYIRSIFDGFAASFDEMLLHRLDYHAPELLMAALGNVLGGPQPLRDVLDAGCGTGLCGPLLKPYARSLIGVDLSAGMLEKARARAVYNSLQQAELTQFLAAHEAAFDVIASADTLCYFGDLMTVAHTARRALRPGGWLGFTVERSDDVDSYRINPHGRYSHARTYVAAVLRAAGFEAVDATQAVLRKEAGSPVEGWVVTARVADSAFER